MIYQQPKYSKLSISRRGELSGSRPLFGQIINSIGHTQKSEIPTRGMRGSGAPAGNSSGSGHLDIDLEF